MPQVLQREQKYQNHSNPTLLKLMDPINGLRVLIIDEDKDDANHMKDMLHQYNFHG
jgi:hypothetical protein